MSTFGDTDPEDEYDASDSPHLRLAVLRRVVAELRHRDDARREARRVDALRLVAIMEREGFGRPELAEIRADLEAL